jgi:hypothetical protein
VGYSLAPHLLLGFDGIAFDQFTRVGMIWSSLLAAIVVMMLVTAEDTGKPQLIPAFVEIARRWRFMLPAIAVVAVVHMLLNVVQGQARAALQAVWQDPAPLHLNLLYFLFVFGFATVRLWATIVILIFGLRESYRSGGPKTVAGAQPPRV